MSGREEESVVRDELKHSEAERRSVSAAESETRLAEPGHSSSDESPSLSLIPHPFLSSCTV